MVVFHLLHRVCSHSIFLQVIEEIYANGSLPISAFRTSGFSPVTMMYTFIVRFRLVIAVVALGCGPLKPGLPLGGSCVRRLRLFAMDSNLMT
jgi:hypothetical protein